MSNPQTIIIFGSARCGAGLVMQMLDAAGIPTTGGWPDYECLTTMGLLDTQPDKFVEAVRGKAVKILDPHRYALPDFGEASAIWVGRKPQHQARSTIKAMNALSVSAPVADTRENRRLITRNLAMERKVAKRFLMKPVTKIGGISFEVILENPRAAAHAICEHFGLDFSLAEQMAQRVVPRGPECLPYMLEIDLVKTVGEPL